MDRNQHSNYVVKKGVFMFSYLLREKQLCEATDLLYEMKKNPLALELLNTLNEQRRREGRPQITATIWRGLKFDADCNPKSGEIRISNKDQKNNQLHSLVFELCNLEAWDNDGYTPLFNTRYPVRREVYIKKSEKTEYNAGNHSIKIYQYGVKNLGWDPEPFKSDIKFFQRPFNDYYHELKTYDDGLAHTEHYGAYWDDVAKYQEELEEYESQHSP